MPLFPEEKSQRKLETLRKKEEEESVKILSQKYDLPYADLTILPIELDALKIISEETARRSQTAIFQQTGNTIRIGLRNPDFKETLKTLAALKEKRYIPELFLVSQSGLTRVWALYQKIAAESRAPSGAIHVSHEKIEQIQREIKTADEISARIKDTQHTRITDTLEVILAGALALDASDIHIEPRHDTVRIRFRLDGVLADVALVPLKLYALLLSRIKLVAELKLNIRDKAQDGRFTIRTGTIEIEVRVSTLPGPDGENVVMRILNPKSISVEFSELGMQPWVAECIDAELKKPNGMILTTGPTGSGKTTTLYTFLKKIHSPTIKIITIEDPIEYHLEGIEQTQVDTEKGYDFANGLRAIVRQDPDAILVGEIRDLETAETAMHASLTGHLVFSTLHTNNAAGTIPRLLDLGVRPSIIAPAINVSMAQRLIRKLCVHCKTALTLTRALEEKIKKELAAFPEKVPTPEQQLWTLFAAASGGCPLCNHTGYKGRSGVFEIILVDKNVEQLVLREPSEFEIMKEGERQNQITMRQDGLLKILIGITDFEEVNRVVGA